MTGLLSRETVNQSFPAGGTDPHWFDCRAVWYPVAYVQDLSRSRPNRFTLLGEDLVIWWEPTSEQWRVYRDQCPHRLAPLSEGRINEVGQLECPYHGWTFTGEGECQTIPQQPDTGVAHTSRRACVRSLPATTRQELLFVYPGEVPENQDLPPIPVVDVLDENSSEWVCLNTFRDIPYDAFTLMENVLDSSHIPYTHHNTVGKRSNVSPVDLEITQRDRQGFTGVWEEGPRKGTLGRQTTTFVAPGLMWHDLTSKQFGRTLTVVYATPIRPGECRLFARFPFKFGSKIPRLAISLTPTWYAHLGQNRVLEDDQVFLHWQERCVAASGGSAHYAQACYLPTKADLFVQALHQWRHDYHVDPFPGQSLPPRSTTDDLLDRYHSHTQHCHSCRNALANWEKVQKVSLAIAVIALSLIPVLVVGFSPSLGLGIGLSLLVAIALGTWLGIERFKQSFLKGHPIPPRNL